MKSTVGETREDPLGRGWNGILTRRRVYKSRFEMVHRNPPFPFLECPSFLVLTPQNLFYFWPYILAASCSFDVPESASKSTSDGNILPYQPSEMNVSCSFL